MHFGYTTICVVHSWPFCNTNISEPLQSEQRDLLNKSVTEMRTSSLLLVITALTILCTSNVHSKHRRRSDKKRKPTHHPKPSKPKPKPKPKPCRRLTHCVTDQWSVWSNCSVACGTNGTQARTRKVSYVTGFLWLIVRNLNCVYEHWS